MALGEPEYGGKGSFPRTWNNAKFRDNYDEIFSKKQVASTSEPSEIGFMVDSPCSESFLREKEAKKNHVPNPAYLTAPYEYGKFGCNGEYLV